MIQELVEFGKRITAGKSKAFRKENFTTVIVINEKGEFQKFIGGGSAETAIITEHDKKKGPIGIIRAKKGHARLLLDKCEEVLGIGDNAKKKHKVFLEVLERYKGVKSLQPVFLFYDEKNKEGLTKAISEFSKLDNNAKSGNITFMVNNDLLLKKEEVRTAIINLYEEDIRKLKDGKICSICGKTDSPILDEPHGLVKMPKGQTAGCALVSYNEAAFMSYGLNGNLNSSICRDCARNYIEGLDFLLTDGYEVPKSEKQKAHYKYNHRIKISDSTVALFWTRQETKDINPFVIMSPDTSWIKGLFESIWSGQKSKGDTVDTNMFYSCTLSSAAARIAVRDWTAISLDEYKKSLAEWFYDIEIEGKDSDLVYSPLKLLINATEKDKKVGEDPKRADSSTKSRIGLILWNAAIKGKSYIIPLEIIQSVLIRIWKGGIFSSERAAIIKLVINRNTNKKMKSILDETNTSMAYLCGRLFAVIESMQWKAIGNVNSSVKDRFFAAAASQPAYIFGTLLTKSVPVYQHKINGYLAKELKEIAGKISEQGSFPLRFSTIEQGEFALGYYFQRTHKTNIETKEDSNL